MARVIRVSGERSTRLNQGWELARLPPEAAADPDALARARPDWQPAQVPGTALSNVTTDSVSLDTRLDADDHDWWFRTRFSAHPERPSALRFDGLATLAEVFLNAKPLLSSDNMFVRHEHDTSGQLASSNELSIRFRSLSRTLAERRGRARFKAPFLSDSRLRLVRTTQFGRMPGWTPIAPAVGPWRPVTLIERGPIAVRRADVRTAVRDRVGTISADFELVSHVGPVESVVLDAGGRQAALQVRPCDDGGVRASGQLALPDVARWWPHTHGAPELYALCAAVCAGGERFEIELGSTGFRTLERAGDPDGFELRINDQPLFCRGACWLPLDALAIDAPLERVRAALLAMQRAGMNMLRVVANGVYERDEFHELCDQLGILVWQDFAFARLDYPSDPAFVAGVEREASQLLDRLQQSPSLVVACGNSEVEQQVSMLGMDPALAKSALFEQVLPELVRRSRPDLVYVPSTPSGGALPFYCDRGTSHYFGVGAYRRPLADARLSEVRFATECLAFSNLPEESALERCCDWKSGIARDLGADWDFEDVRQHYLEVWFGSGARALERSDPDRWRELGRVVTGEIMSRVLGEWRRRRSPTRGALIWHLADVCPGAGCGLLDDRGQPKPVYWFVARALSPIAVHLSDEGLNGVRAHVHNETERAVAAELCVSLLRDGKIFVARGRSSLALPPRSEIELPLETVLGGFVDSSFAYRFGPAGHQLIAAWLRDLASGELLSEAFHFPLGPIIEPRDDLGLCATASTRGGCLELEIRADELAYAVRIDAAGMTPSDNYFHLEPGRPRRVTLGSNRHATPSAPVFVSALNASAKVRAAASAEAAE